MVLSVSLRWHDPDQVLGFDLSPGFLSGTPLTVATKYTKVIPGRQGELILSPLPLSFPSKKGKERGMIDLR
jgi:hypothetical protein